MSSIYPSNKIYLEKSKIPESGKGIFASKNIRKGEIIEIAPILVLEFSDLVDTKWNLFFEYYFWMDDFVALALGFASMYNHSADANCKYELDRKNKIITFTAIKDIIKDEEILFNYKGSTTAKAPLWFERLK